MSKEIVEAVRGLAAEKNISAEKLMEALEDALLSAYKKTPGAARYARVEIDRASGRRASAWRPNSCSERPRQNSAKSLVGARSTTA